MKRNELIDSKTMQHRQKQRVSNNKRKVSRIDAVIESSSTPQIRYLIGSFELIFFKDGENDVILPNFRLNQGYRCSTKVSHSFFLKNTK